MEMMLLAILLAMQADTHSEPPQSLATLGVCDVLAEDPTRLNGKVVKVRGFFSGTDEGNWLSGECKTHLVTKGLAWGSDLWVSVNFFDKNTLRSWEAMTEKLKQLHGNTRRDRVWVTIVGRLETRATMDDEVVQMPYGLARAGFGHVGGSPAQINVISVEDVRVERQPAESKK